MPRHEVRTLMLALVFGATTAWPAVPPACAEPTEHPLRGGAWALQFQVEVLGLGGSVGLSAKRHFTDRSALGLSLAVSKGSSERGSKDDNPFVPGQFFEMTESKGTTFRVAAPYFFYPCPRPGVNVFLTAAPFASWRHFEDSRASLSIRESETVLVRSRFEEETRSFGAEVEVGFEWFFTRRLSLFTSHGISVSHSRQDSERREERESTAGPPEGSLSVGRSETSAINVSTTEAELGFSVYF